MDELMMADLYSVSLNYPLDSIHMRSIFLLYQPLIGNMACSLYLTLAAETDQLTLTKTFGIHSRLTKITGLSLQQLQEASLKLEAVGLLDKYRKDSEGKRIYLYLLKLPLTPTKFFNHAILGTLLLQRLGKEEFYRTKICFKSSAHSFDGYQNISAKFNDVFDLSVLQETSRPNVEKDYFNVEYAKPEKDYDMTLFYQNLGNYQIKQSCLTSDNEQLIKQLGTLYRINALDMLSLVKDNLIDDKLNQEGLKNSCRDYFDLSKPEKFSEIYHKQPLIYKSKQGQDALSLHINYLESINPYQLLKDKQGGRTPLKHDLQIVESIMTSLYLEPGVMNVLIELTLSQCNNAISRSFMQARASQWKRKKINTVKEAMDEANLYLKYRRGQRDDEPESVSMVDTSNLDEAKLNEFLSQFE